MALLKAMRFIDVLAADRQVVGPDADSSIRP